MGLSPVMSVLFVFSSLHFYLFPQLTPTLLSIPYLWHSISCSSALDDVHACSFIIYGSRGIVSFESSRWDHNQSAKMAVLCRLSCCRGELQRSSFSDHKRGYRSAGRNSVNGFGAVHWGYMPDTIFSALQGVCGARCVVYPIVFHLRYFLFSKLLMFGAAGCINLMQSSKDEFLAAFSGEDLHEQAQKTNPGKGNFYKMSKEVSSFYMWLCIPHPLMAVSSMEGIFSSVDSCIFLA